MPGRSSRLAKQARKSRALKGERVGRANQLLAIQQTIERQASLQWTVVGMPLLNPGERDLSNLLAHPDHQRDTFSRCRPPMRIELLLPCIPRRIAAGPRWVHTHLATIVFPGASQAPPVTRDRKLADRGSYLSPKNEPKALL
jgi:hypothetical protein